VTKDLEYFFDRIFVNNKTNWWENLKSETNNNKGRCLQSTLEAELFDIPEYRKSDRQLFFFSSHKASSIDGCYKSIGVEEKYNPLDLKDHLIDGAIHRGFVWVFGRPQNRPDPLEAVSLYVVKDGSAPISGEATDLYFPLIHSLDKYGIHIVFIDGKTGDYWTLDRDNGKPLPTWLSDKDAPIVWDKDIDLVKKENIEAVNALNDPKLIENKVKRTKYIPGLGKRGQFQEVEISSSSRGAIMNYGNEWRLIELGLLLRSYGYDAVKMTYNKEKHKNPKDKLKNKVPAGRGVEKRVAHEILSRFSVSIDWGTKL